MLTESHSSPRSCVTSARCDIGRCSSLLIHGVNQDSTLTRVIPSGSAERWFGNRSFVKWPVSSAQGRLDWTRIVGPVAGGPPGALDVWLMALAQRASLRGPHRLRHHRIDTVTLLLEGHEDGSIEHAAARQL